VPQRKVLAGLPRIHGGGNRFKGHTA
jgi:hypothetical protein